MPTERENPDVRMCPSYPATPGAQLIGIVDGDGRVGYVTPGLTVDQRFLDLVSTGRRPEERFRFSHACATSGCQYWAQAKCQVVELALSAAHGEGESELPHCAIRHECQWFSQRGRDACRVCPMIVNHHPGVHKPTQTDAGAKELT